MNNRRKLSFGFTLVELLVVISIIAVLLAVLMPSLSKAREMAKTIICQTNLKGLGTAWDAYAIANNGLIVSSLTYKTLDEGDVRADYSKYSWVYAPVNLTTKESIPEKQKAKETPEQAQYGIKQGKLFPYAPDFGVYRCGSDKTGHFRSFSIIDHLNGAQDFMTGTYKRPWNNITKTSQIKRSSESYVFMEEDDTRAYNVDSWEPVITISGVNGDSKTTFQYDPLAIRHSGYTKSNFAFADGHSEQHRWSKETIDFFAGYRKTGGSYQWRVFEPMTEMGKLDIEWLERGRPKK
jgi:prepilin-type N-terminal cleavage/methylation domain-containing protein/prepilin-type processing-associated H-X9-DG protein